MDPGDGGRRIRVPPGQWYLHLFDTSQPDWNWHHPDVPALFEDVIRFADGYRRGLVRPPQDPQALPRAGGLPQVFNFLLILEAWRAADFRGGIDTAIAGAYGSRAPWVTGNHDVPRPASRYRLDEEFTPEMTARLIARGDRNAEGGARRARAAALVLLALPATAAAFPSPGPRPAPVSVFPNEGRRFPRGSQAATSARGRRGSRPPRDSPRQRPYRR